MSVLNSVPQEVLERVAFFAVLPTLIGPPSQLVPLLLVSRKFESCLSLRANPYLYARIFARKFDHASHVRRLGQERTSNLQLANELRRRFVVLRRIRDQQGCFANPSDEEDTDESEMRSVHETLFTAYVLMLENDGTNERQLRDFAHIDVWISHFWFDIRGSSYAAVTVQNNAWPIYNDISSFAMWLFWLLLRTDNYISMEKSQLRTIVAILKGFALGAHQYPLTIPAPDENTHSTPPTYGSYPPLTPPSLACPAILSFLLLAPLLSNNAPGLQDTEPLLPSTVSLSVPTSDEWEYEWQRSVSNASVLKPSDSPVAVFAPGSLPGIWEGLFTYIDFTAYGALLAGAPPGKLFSSIVARHKQTFRLREFHLLSPPPDADANADEYRPISIGDPLRAGLPHNLDIQEDGTGIHVLEGGRSAPVFYARSYRNSDPEYARQIRDILIVGEGHSAWGEFNLVGRVRLRDGLVTISKEYLASDRGSWLYRGFLIGEKNGNLAGRWRDTLSPPSQMGYEGCFFMTSRR